MHRQSIRKQARTSPWVAAVGAFAAAATVGMVVASAVSVADFRVKEPLRNPFDGAGVVR